MPGSGRRHARRVRSPGFPPHVRQHCRANTCRLDCRHSGWASGEPVGALSLLGLVIDIASVGREIMWQFVCAGGARACRFLGVQFLSAVEC
jgi:hypothetical protein